MAASLSVMRRGSVSAEPRRSEWSPDDADRLGQRLVKWRRSCSFSSLGVAVNASRSQSWTRTSTGCAAFFLSSSPVATYRLVQFHGSGTVKSISKLFLCVGLALFVHAFDAADTSTISGETQNALDRLSSQMEALVTEMRLLRQELRELRKQRGASVTADAPSQKPPQSVSLQLDADDPSLGNPSARGCSWSSPTTNAPIALSSMRRHCRASGIDISKRER